MEVWREIYPDGWSKPTSLDRLPNEILINIASFLSPVDLRHLETLNERLRAFVYDYRFRCTPYKPWLLDLPAEVIIRIVRTLKWKHTWPLAKANPRLYRPIMDDVIRRKVRDKRQWTLGWAVKWYHYNMVRTFLHYGADVDTRSVFSGKGPYFDLPPTCLEYAAYWGIHKLVEIFLEAGASQSLDGALYPLKYAISRGHEKVALRLSADPDIGEKYLPATEVSTVLPCACTVLQYACIARLENLVRFYLDRKPSPQNCNEALHWILSRDEDSDELTLERKLREPTFRIVSMLLRHGAQSDTCMACGGDEPKTVYARASQHVDPRIRILFQNPSPLDIHKVHTLRIGRTWLADELATPAFDKREPEGGHPTILRDFRMSTPKSNRLEAECDQEEHVSAAAEIALPPLAEEKSQEHIKVTGPKKVPALSAFPQLSPVPEAVQTPCAAQTSWAKFLLQTPSCSGKEDAWNTAQKDANRPSTKRSRKSDPGENTPRLGEIILASPFERWDLQALFKESNHGQDSEENQWALLHQEWIVVKRSFNGRKRRWKGSL